MERIEYQINLHFGDRTISAFSAKKGLVFARSLGR